MTTAELIEKLRAYAPETRVVVQGYEGGYDDIARIRPVSINLNANPEWYYGKHGNANAGDEGAEQAVLLFSRVRHGD